jgi:predicted lipoprotein with Yx(FWY)xxD motif
MRRAIAGAISLLAVTIAIAGCGGGKSSSSASSSEGGKAGTGAGGRYNYGEESSSSSTSAAAGGPTALTTKSNATLGTILAAGPKRLTVYMFMADHGGKSSCYGACASSWPPVTVSGAPKVEGGAMKSKVGTTKRSDGTTQLTYAGRPIYYYTPDTSEASVIGQGVNSFGALWYVMSPSGTVITKP